MMIKYMNLTTLICVLTLTVLFLSPVFTIKKNQLFVLKNDLGRNEGSTPRTFVLPATPAVAREQERKKGLLLRKEEIQNCMVKLYDKGFRNLGSFDDFFSFKITQSIIEYQTKENIIVSGEFDKQTKLKLGC